MKSLLRLAVLALLFCCANEAYAQTYNEVGDAGETPATAQTVSGTGLLTRINGTLCVGNADVYLINITNGAAFAASTVGATTINTQLFLFTESGIGLIGNDDTGSLAFQSQIGPGLFFPNGHYYLGISGVGYDPINAGGLEIFSDNFTVTKTPLPSRGPFAGFGSNINTSASGAYGINLTGATFISAAAPVPDSTTMLLLGTGLGRHRGEGAPSASKAAITPSPPCE